MAAEASTYQHRASQTESTESNSSSTGRVPQCILKLLDVAIFSFSCLAGIRSGNKVRGDPVVEGIASMFGQLLMVANKETREAFGRVSGWGSWRPGQQATKELMNYISSRLRTKLRTGMFNEDNNPVVPDLIVKRSQTFDEARDVLRTTSHPRCWCCGQKRRYCKLVKQKEIPASTFGLPRTELVSPFLDVLDALAEEFESGEESSTTDESDTDGCVDVDHLQLLSENDLLDYSESDVEPENAEADENSL